MKRIATIVCAIAFGIMALAIVSLPERSNNSIEMESYGTIVYPEVPPIPQEPSSPFSWYLMFKEIMWFVFSAIGAVSGIIKILEYRKKHSGQKLHVLNVSRYTK